MVELADLIRPGVGRGLDFVILDDLRKRTGISVSEILKFSVAEMIANSLDTNANELRITTRTVGEFDEVTVGDNGSKQILLEELELILDFGNKASSKRGFLRVSRGYLGNALKCLFGYSYALAENRKLSPPEIIVKSHKAEYTINLKPDRVREVIDSEIVTREIEDTGFNSVILRFPIYRGTIGNNEPIKEYDDIQKIIFATSIVNPHIKFVYDLWGIKKELGEALDTSTLRNETSVLWYEPKQFETLFYDFVRGRPVTQLREFISLFRGFTSKKIQKRVKEKLQELNDAGNHDSPVGSHVQFFPTVQIQVLSTEDVGRLYAIMRELAKPIAKRSVPKVLGVVGEERFERVKEQHGWKRLRHTVMKGRKKDPWGRSAANFPFLVELAVFDRKEDDELGLQVFQCVNFMASMEDIFSRLFNIKYRLGRVGITEKSPVTVMVHLVCPVLKWLNYGKSGLYE